MSGWVKRQTSLPPSFPMTTKFIGRCVLTEQKVRRTKTLTPIQICYLNIRDLSPEMFSMLP
jgi:hypothetical protein